MQQQLQECEKKTVSLGPWGGQDGFKWDDGMYSTVRQIVIAHGAGIDYIQIEYDRKGSSVWSEKHGGKGGNKVDTVKLNYPTEYLTSIQGYYGSFLNMGAVIVRSLTFHSNMRSYGPFGVEQGSSFALSMTGGKIVGFHGKSGWYLDAIGVHLKPYQEQKKSKILVQGLQTQSYLAHGSERSGYSVMHGQIGNGYDIVLAVKQREDQRYNAVEGKFSAQVSETGDYSKVETKEKVHSVEKVTKKIEGLETCGPWGGSKGTKFDDGIYTGIRQIHLSRNLGLVSMRVLYDRNGEAIWGSKQGGTGGLKNDKVIFDYPNEILTHITGTHEPLMKMGPTVIRSITFHTNKGKYGPFGEENGQSFTSKVKEGKIVGFHGRGGLFIDAIGIHMIECKVPPAPPAPIPVHNSNDKIEANGAKTDYPWSNKFHLPKPVPNEEVSCGIVKEPAPYGPGPWGGDGGRPWDDGVFSGIKQIYLTRGEAICSIQIEYDRNGQSVWSLKHGGNGGIIAHRIKLEYPNEVLTCISGYYAPICKEEGPKVIRSLTFYTSRGKFGPFGEEVGNFFTSTTTEGKVVGFHGRSGLYLDAIGVHMQHWLGNQKQTRSLFRKGN
ncbi:jacalin-related lectin 3 isoform X2 [Punica granatum]|uniref:Jacalin-related lectin 3 isoform X2 n=1 Tax=Punica granatum TaxID=22663 RepID=A0A6P8EFX6_PUNGR|nr:jacalin-related lectin 3 isoform X2 [Punica granatum]